MLSPRARAQLIIVAVTMAIGTTVGVIYGALIKQADPTSPIVGACAGILISSTLVCSELFVFNGPFGRPLTRLPIWLYFVVKTGTFLAVIVAGMAVAQVAGARLGSLLLGRDVDFPVVIAIRDVAFSAIVSAAFVFYFMLDRLLGGGVLAGLITGRYMRPRVEERVFLLADLVDSTGLAERLGEARFLDYLNDLFTDIATPVQEQRGGIHRYVGDAVIVSWRLARVGRGRNPLACAFAIRAVLAARADAYRRRYGEAPAVRVALHAGPVATGEIGDLKREIAFMGDTMNTLARIEGTAKAENCAVLASQAMLDTCPLPDGVRAAPLAAPPLKGKGQPVPLFALTRHVPPHS